MKAFIAPLLLASAAAFAADPSPPAPSKITEGVWLVPEIPTAEHEPDGNTVIFKAPQGLVVMDTGRHLWHRQAILNFAASSRQSIAAVVNSHWHLDHVSGNPTLRAKYPKLKVYASSAIDGALARFLAEGAHRSDKYLEDPNIPEATKADIRADRDTIQHGAELRPDIVIGESQTLTIAGREFQVNLAVNAATAGDVWLYDAKSGVAAIGDLVTLPAPYLDTACPDGWSAALAAVAQTPFKIAVPGHGPLLSRASFEQYQHAFAAFIECSHSARDAKECGSEWSKSVESLLARGQSHLDEARDTAVYYVGMLRANGGRSKYCEEPAKA